MTSQTMNQQKHRQKFNTHFQKNSGTSSTRIRREWIIFSLFALSLYLSQRQIPTFQERKNIEEQPVSFLRLPTHELGQEYIDQDQDLSDDEVVSRNSQSSSSEDHSATIVQLTPPALQIFQNYQFYHSQFALDQQEDSCHERTNRGSSQDMAEVIHNEDWCPELSSKKFLIVDWIDLCDMSDILDRQNNKTSTTTTTSRRLLSKSSITTNNGIQIFENFLRSIAWAMVTDRTVLVRDITFEEQNSDFTATKTSSCEDTGCAQLYKEVSQCQGYAKLDPWLPSYDVWKKEYGWPDDIIESVQDPSLLEFNASFQDTSSHKVMYLQNPPPFSEAQTYKKKFSKPKSISVIEAFMESSTLYGMIVDETILLKEDASAAIFESSVDSISQDDDNTNTDNGMRNDYDDDGLLDLESNKHGRRYIVQAVAARASECPLEFEEPCIIYQIGSEPVDPSSCIVHVVASSESVKGDEDGITRFMEILSVAGYALDGAVLSPDLPLREYLIQVLEYRGKWESKHFELKGCWDR